ncbi:MAG TPA: ribokinase [Anaerolineae bacterium]|nr:ribokinase [Anaerolineae bacterium]
MTASIAVVGSLNMDLVIRSPRIPRPGETILGGELHTVPGGKGANQAVAAARLEAQVYMVGRVGRDAFAGALVENLAADGIDHTFVVQDEETATGVALIVVDDDGENSIVVSSGANMRLSPADVEAAESVIAAADLLILQLEVPLESVIRGAELARAHGVKVVLNPAPARPLPAGLLSLVDVLVPNESEAALLADLPAGTQSEAEKAAEALLQSGVGTVILTLGERGALTIRDGITQAFPAYEVKPVDTTAAGDAFVAGLAVALAEGKGLYEAVQWANAAGGLATTKLGAQPSLPTRQALESLLSDGSLKSSQGDRR